MSFQIQIGLHLYILLCLSISRIFLNGVHGNWEISAQLNPKCTDLCETLNLVYIRAQNGSSSVHTFLDVFSDSPPSILMVHSTDPDARAIIDWNLLANRSKPSEAIEVAGTTQSYGLIFTTIVDYDDEQNLADIALISSEASNSMYMRSWRWSLDTALNPSKSYPIGRDLFEIVYSANSTDPIFSDSGSVQLKILLTNSSRTNPLLPALSFVPGLSLQFELILDHLVSQFTHGRFALQLTLVTNETLFPADDYVHTSLVSIDDEVTPGIFQTVNINLGQAVAPDNDASLSSYHPQPAAFLQTRPICYTLNTSSRDIKSSRDVRLGGHSDFLTKPQRRATRGSLPYMFFGDRFLPQFQATKSAHEWNLLFANTDKQPPVGMRIQNVSFGTPEDGFYNASRYLVWTASFGLGEAPRHGMSPLLIGLITLSVCVILASLIFGSLTLIILRQKRRNGQRQNFSLLNESQEAFTSVPA